MELGRIIVRNPQEVERAKPQVRKGSQVEEEKLNGFSNQRELAVWPNQLTKAHQNYNTEPKLGSDVQRNCMFFVQNSLYNIITA